MSNIAKLKKRAAEFEARKQFDKALELYEQVLNTTRGNEEERDVPLFNRVGDLHYRIGNTEQAIGYYELAADLYADGGFFNNAIALCNKILRYSPGRTIIYYKLGIISAKKGFNSDAKQNFLEYADRMQRIGKMDEAWNALKEFADLCPGQDDVRLMLADQLSRADRKTEALEQLELLYDTLLTEGRSTEASATLERMRALDPGFKPKRATTPRKRKKGGLVFLDLEPDVPSPSQRTPGYSTDDDPATPADPFPETLSEERTGGRPEGLETTSLDPDESDRPDEPKPAGELDAEQATPPSPRPRRTTPYMPTRLPVVDPLAGLDVIATGLTAEYSVSGATGPGAASDAEAPATANTPATPDEEYVDLGEWLERTRTPASTRMVTFDEEPENDEQKDFAEMLEKFKAGISRNVDEEDFESHYDLGIAFREMGLLDEAIGSFQKASRGRDQRIRASEAIGQCFLDKGEAAVALTVLERLLHEPDMTDARLVGVLYLLGSAAESLGRPAEASAYFQRVLAVQIGFRDAAERLASLAPASG